MAETKPPHSSSTFTSHPSISPFAVPCATYLSTHPEKLEYKYIATGALVFDSSTPSRILLIQRASHDSMGSLWEIPGGGCDNEDLSILHGVGRELWEETGLTAVRIGPKVGKDHVFPTRSGKIVGKLNFLVEAEKGLNGSFDVKLDPNEHQAFVWATEEEAKAGKVGDMEFKFTTNEQRSVVLEAFRVTKEMEVDSGKT